MLSEIEEWQQPAPELRVIWNGRRGRLPSSCDRGHIQHGDTMDRKGHLQMQQVAFLYEWGWG